MRPIQCMDLSVLSILRQAVCLLGKATELRSWCQLQLLSPGTSEAGLLGQEAAHHHGGALTRTENLQCFS